jgi:hypothetical protein
MIDLPLPTIITRIATEKGMTEEQVRTRIRAKLSELSSLISEEGAAHIIANELGVKLHAIEQKLTIDKLLGGMRGLEVVAKVRQVYETREFNTGGRQGKVASLLVVDATGITRLVLWNEHADLAQEIVAGDVVKVKGAYVKSNQGRVELHLGNDGRIYRNPEGVVIDVDVTAAPARPQAQVKRLAELSEQDQNVLVYGTIVQVFEPRFFPNCPTCNGKVQEVAGKASCPTHGAVTPVYTYVMNLYLDDGSDNIRCALWRDQVDKVLAKPKTEVLAFKDNPAAFEPLKTDLLGLVIKVRGRVQKNEAFGRLELIGFDVVRDVDPDAELKAAAPREDDHPAPPPQPAVKHVAQNTVAPSPVVPPAPQPTPAPRSQKHHAAPSAPAAPAAKTEEEDIFTLDDLEDLEDE